MVHAGVVALHIGAEDERVGGEMLVHEPDGGFRPTPPFQVVAVRGEVRKPLRKKDMHFVDGSGQKSTRQSASPQLTPGLNGPG